MESVESNTAPSAFRIFKTNNGAHTPETLAEMTIAQLMNPADSNPVKVAALRTSLTMAHAAIQQMIRRLYELSPGMDDVTRRAVNTILAREFATSLDIERQHAELSK